MYHNLHMKILTVYLKWTLKFGNAFLSLPELSKTEINPYKMQSSPLQKNTLLNSLYNFCRCYLAF